MKPRARRIIPIGCAVAAAVLAIIAWLGYEWFSPGSSHNQAAAIRCTLAWARLAPLPSSAQHIATTARGGMFTRTFDTSFTAPAAEITEWLQQSPGTRESDPSAPSPEVRLYVITPGGGASSARVTVDDKTHHVSIHVSWS